MKQKNFFIFIILSIFLSFSSPLNTFAMNTEFTASVSKLKQTIEQNTHTMTLQFTEPSRLGDRYSWLITSEPGQLAPSLCLFTLSAPNSKVFGEDTEIILVQDAIDLDTICNIFHLNYKTCNNLLTVTKPITVNYYYQSDVENAYPIMLLPHYDILLEQNPIKQAIDVTKIVIGKQK